MDAPAVEPFVQVGVFSRAEQWQAPALGAEMGGGLRTPRFSIDIWGAKVGQRPAALRTRPADAYDALGLSSQGYQMTGGVLATVAWFPVYASAQTAGLGVCLGGGLLWTGTPLVSLLPSVPYAVENETIPSLGVGLVVQSAKQHSLRGRVMLYGDNPQRPEQNAARVQVGDVWATSKVYFEVAYLWGIPRDKP